MSFTKQKRDSVKSMNGFRKRDHLQQSAFLNMHKNHWVMLSMSNFQMLVLNSVLVVSFFLGSVYEVFLMSFDFLTEEVGAVESVKAASEIYTPVSGKVLEVNNALEEKPGLVNTSCYDQGWLFKIQIKDENEYEKLMSKEAYDNFLKTVKQ